MHLTFIRYLAAGISMRSISYMYRLGLSTVSYTIKNTCAAIWEALNLEYLPLPTEDMWKNIADGFAAKWNFPNCVGAIDGKHVRIQVITHKCFLITFYNYVFLGTTEYWIRFF